MADGEEKPSENFRKNEPRLSDSDDSDNEPPPLVSGAKHAKRTEKSSNHFDNAGASSE